MTDLQTPAVPACPCGCGCPQCGGAGPAPAPTGGEVRDELIAVVRRVPDTIDDVVDRLREIETITNAWPPGGKRNGIACFTRLYLQITEDVKGRYDAGDFGSGRFIEELDVAFARRYLAALEAWLTGAPSTPGCWAIVFDRREQDIPEWRFAAAGVNAHVNFDLAFALLDVWTAHPDPLAATEAQRDDYDLINQIFYSNMESLCERFQAPLSELHRHGFWERLANFVGDVLVWGTRDIAWVYAEKMWPHRGTEDYRIAPTESLDLLATGFAKMMI